MDPPGTLSIDGLPFTAPSLDKVNVPSINPKCTSTTSTQTNSIYFQALPLLNDQFHYIPHPKLTHIVLYLSRLWKLNLFKSNWRRPKQH